MKEPKFIQDLEKTIQVNSNPMPVGYYNLLISIRDLEWYSKGLRPHRNWRITDVKKYFGISGSAIKMVAKLRDIKKHMNDE